MAVTSKTSLSLCLYNCQGFKNSVFTLNSLCDDYDVVLIQEHWLLPNELDLLHNVHFDFMDLVLLRLT